MRPKEGETVTEIEISDIAQQLTHVVRALRAMADKGANPHGRRETFMFGLEGVERTLEDYVSTGTLPLLLEVARELINFAYTIANWYDFQSDEERQKHNRLLAVLKAVEDGQLEFLKLQAETMKRFTETLSNDQEFGTRASMLAALESTPAAPSAPVEAS